MPVMFKLLPQEALDGSGFAVDAAGVSFKTYDVVRTRLQDGLTGLLVAARMARNPTTELLSRPVDQDLLGCVFLTLLAGSLGEFAVDEGRSGADQGDEVGGVDGPPAVLR